MDLIGRRPALDGLRGVSVLMVVAFHANLLGGGWLGVQMFFVLSGFLITTLLLEERQRSGRIRLLGFYARRCRRLGPALLLLLAFLGVYGLVVRTPLTRTLPTETLLAVTYSANLVGGFRSNPGVMLSHLWSLAAEEQFYMIWPAMLLVIAPWLHPRRAIALCLAAIVAVTVWRLGLWAHGARFNRLYYAPDARADGLLVGCLLALLRRRGLRAGKRALCVGTMIVLACIALGVMPLHDDERMPLLRLLMVMSGGTAGTAILLAAVVEAAPAALTWAPLRQVGRVSYGLYLWQLPLQCILFPTRVNPVVCFVAVSTVSWLVASFSHHVVEQRFMCSSTTRARPRPLQPAVSLAA